MWRELAWSDESDAHIAGHGVTPSEVEEVVNTRPRWERPGRDDSTLIYGRTEAGRNLLVVLAESADGRWYVATARQLTDSETRTLLRKDADLVTSKTRLEVLAEHYDSNDTSAELRDAVAPNGPGSPSAADRMTTFAVRLPLPVLERVRELAGQSGVTTSGLIRRWIEAGIVEDPTSAEGRVVAVEALLELIGRAPRGAVDG